LGKPNVTAASHRNKPAAHGFAGFIRHFKVQSSISWACVAALTVLPLYLSTLQTPINGLPSPYTTDVGEIQNALPRWGLLHPSGYPIYSLTSSAFVSTLRAIGISPVLGASLFSTVAGLLCVASRTPCTGVGCPQALCPVGRHSNRIGDVHMDRRLHCRGARAFARFYPEHLVVGAKIPPLGETECAPGSDARVHPRDRASASCGALGPVGCRAVLET
jgi:hypothetical protein